jgi:selenocysteine lyase/cysteine desulfurase
VKTAWACRDSHILYNKLPYKFEAGTPDVAGAIGLGAAIEYVNGLGMDNIAAQEHELLAYATEAISAIPGIRLIGVEREKAGVLSFLLDSIHPHDTQSLYARDSRWRWAPRDRSGIFDNRAPKCRQHFGISIGGKLLTEFVRITGVTGYRSPRVPFTSKRLRQLGVNAALP